MNSMTSAISVVSAAFLGSLVEVVEAFTIILAAATFRGWRPAIVGALAASFVLAGIVAVLGPALGSIPIQWLQSAVGILLLLFGLRWLRKAILRYGGIIQLHDESTAFATEAAYLRHASLQQHARLSWMAGITAFKAVLLEGTEVVFIVIAVGAGHQMIGPAAIGAAAAAALVLAIGVVVHRPLTRVPENTLKFVVGLLLSSFGVFWTGEGLGIAWPGGDLTLIAFMVVFAAASLLSIRALRAAIGEVVP